MLGVHAPAQDMALQRKDSQIAWAHLCFYEQLEMALSTVENLGRNQEQILT